MMRILIVDDEKQIRRILAVLLAEHGYEVAEAETGENALDQQAVFQPGIVLIDQSLPGIDGLETLRRLLAKEPRPDCVMMTAYGTIRSAVETMKAGAFDYLTKPFDNDELLLIIRRILEMRRLTAEVEELRTELETRYGFSEIIGISREMQDVFRVMSRVAAVDATVLVAGDSGTGKELVARAIHRRSRRTAGPFVAVNCSAIPLTLFEAEMFGYEKGAFTDAREGRPGRFELAQGGTLFLDEVGDLAPDAQAKLLRVLQDHHLLDRFNRELGLAVRGMSPLARRLLVEYDWPGNVRELENTLCRAMILCEGDLLTERDLPPRIRGELDGAAGAALSDLHPLRLVDAVDEATARLEKVLILARLAECKGNRTAAADSLGISRKTLFNKMRQYALTWDGDEE